MELIDMVWRRRHAPKTKSAHSHRFNYYNDRNTQLHIAIVTYIPVLNKSGVVTFNTCYHYVTVVML